MEKIIAIANFDASTNPFQQIGGHRILFDPEWVGYLLGSLILFVGIMCFFFYPKAKRAKDAYKASQLAAYNKKYNKKETVYERTGMYLPMGQRAKMFFPVLMGIVFCAIGIALLTTQTIFSL